MEAARTLLLVDSGFSGLGINLDFLGLSVGVDNFNLVERPAIFLAESESD